MAIEILIVEDFEPFRRLVSSRLQERGEFHVSEASDGLEALRKIEELQPELIILDLNLPNLNGIEVCKCSCKLAPTAKVLFLSQEFSADLVEEALREGAQGYIRKIHTFRDLSAAIGTALKGERFVSSGLPAFSSTQCSSTEEDQSIQPGVRASHVESYRWQQTVAEAFKSSLQLLPQKINAAERAIAARLKASNPMDMEERLAVKSALRSLTLLLAETKPQKASHKDKKRA